MLKVLFVILHSVYIWSWKVYLKIGKFHVGKLFWEVTIARNYPILVKFSNFSKIFPTLVKFFQLFFQLRLMISYTVKIGTNSDSKELSKMDEETFTKTLSVLSKKPKVKVIYSPNLNILAWLGCMTMFKCLNSTCHGKHINK